MNSREKVINAELQIRQVIAGDLENLDCPFCGSENLPHQEAMCCEELATVVDAVLDYMETKKQLEIVDRAMEYLDKLKNAQSNMVTIQ